MEWKHLGTEALIALYLLKTKQHAYNLRDSVMIEPNYIRAANTHAFATCSSPWGKSKWLIFESFKAYACMKELMGAQLNIAM